MTPSRSWFRYTIGTGLALALLLLLVETAMLDLYHEEPLRLLVAVSMLKDGFWLVPHVLGEVYLKKPPGFNWMVALLSLPVGEVTRFSGRSVSILSWLFLSGVIGAAAGLLRDRMARYCAVLTGLFSLILFVEKPALAEIDLLFSLQLAGALVGWYRLRRGGYVNAAWVLGHVLLAWALLTKGPVAYLFFYLPVALLVVMERVRVGWRGLAAGFLLAHLITGAWLTSLIQSVGWKRYVSVTLGETVGRGQWDLAAYVEQLFSFPVLTLLSLLPWVFLYGGLLIGRVRNRFGTYLLRSRAGHLIVAGCTPWVFFWLWPADPIRYVLPVFPYLALGIGLMVQVLNEQDDLSAVLRYANRALGCLLGGMLFLPWVLGATEGLLPYRELILGSVLISCSGLFIAYWTTQRRYSIRAGIVSLLVFILIVKTGYLFLYLPADEPALFRTRYFVNRFASTIRPLSRFPIAYRTNNHLELPYYLMKNGFVLHKVTRSSNYHSYRYHIDEHNSPVLVEIRSIPLPGGDRLRLFERSASR